MTPHQRELARHALGLPNKKHTSYRNHFCIGKGGDGYEEWEAMVAAGEAVKRTGPHWGGDDMFFLTLAGALQARDAKEHISREDRSRDEGKRMKRLHAKRDLPYESTTNLTLCSRHVDRGQIAAFESGVTCKNCLNVLAFRRECEAEKNKETTDGNA